MTKANEILLQRWAGKAEIFPGSDNAKQRHLLNKPITFQRYHMLSHYCYGATRLRLSLHNLVRRYNQPLHLELFVL